MVTYRTCIFCNRNDSRPAKEHIFANWIAKEFPNSSEWEAVFGTGPTKYKTKKTFGYTSNKVCGRCNHGRMSNLERDAKQVMSQLIHGQRVTLNWDMQLRMCVVIQSVHELGIETNFAAETTVSA